MQLSHNELQNLYDNFLNDEIKIGIVKFMKQNLEDPDFTYETEMIWRVDCEIGGIGGYCMPANPTRNPFPAGIERELYRPLQYARSNIDICDVRLFARYVIEISGMHLEAVCRLFFRLRMTLGSLRFKGTTLGKMVHKIEKMGEFEPHIIDALYKFVAVYNKSKQEINQDESRDRMFNAYDAIVAYFVVRVLGIAILQKLEISESFDRYEINFDKKW